MRSFWHDFLSQIKRNSEETQIVLSTCVRSLVLSCIVSCIARRYKDGPRAPASFMSCSSPSPWVRLWFQCRRWESHGECTRLSDGDGELWYWGGLWTHLSGAVLLCWARGDSMVSWSDSPWLGLLHSMFLHFWRSERCVGRLRSRSSVRLFVTVYFVTVGHASDLAIAKGCRVLSGPNETVELDHLLINLDPAVLAEIVAIPCWDGHVTWTR